MDNHINKFNSIPSLSDQEISLLLKCSEVALALHRRASLLLIKNDHVFVPYRQRWLSYCVRLINLGLRVGLVFGPSRLVFNQQGEFDLASEPRTASWIPVELDSRRTLDYQEVKWLFQEFLDYKPEAEINRILQEREQSCYPAHICSSTYRRCFLCFSIGGAEPRCSRWFVFEVDFNYNTMALILEPLVFGKAGY